MTSNEIQQLAANISPTDFETLLRLYIARVTNDTTDHVLFSHVKMLNRSQWSIAGGTTVPGGTTGEFLADVYVEHERRREFEKSNKLKMIEG